MIGRRHLAASLAAAVAATAGVLGAPRAALAAYPERPITMVCPWGAGGGTDATARIVSSLLEKELGVPVNVVNRTGGSGVVGHSAIATAQPDGYTLGIITVEIGMMHWQGLTELTSKDYTPLALFNEDPAGLQVRADAPYPDAKALLEAVKGAQKGELKASGTGQGGIWHLALAGMLQAAGMPPDQVQWVPSQGAAPGLQDLVAGGVEIVPSSVPEAKSLIDAGRVKSLAVMAPARNPAFADVPTLEEATGLKWTIGAWRGFAGPKGLPQEVVDRLVPALARVYESKDFKDFMAQRGFGTIYLAPAEFERFMAERDASLGEVMKGLGLAK
jgi:tripartite-type tricarboxylate transporter receptor subunit TctC